MFILTLWICVHPALDVQGLRRNIGMIFQKPVPFPLSIRRNIELPLREHGMSKQADLNEVMQQVLLDVGLWDEVKDRLESSAQALVRRTATTAVYRQGIGIATESIING